MVNLRTPAASMVPTGQPGDPLPCATFPRHTRSLPAATERNRKRGREGPLRGMMGVVVPRRHVVPSRGLRLDALRASEAGASRRSPPPPAILSAARRSLGPGAGGAVPSGAVGQAVEQFRREKRKRQQLWQWECVTSG